jgi:hypothetical protein
LRAGGREAAQQHSKYNEITTRNLHSERGLLGSYSV